MQNKDYLKLRSCPFCGGRAWVMEEEKYDGEWSETVFAECGECGTRTRAYHSFTVEEKRELAKHVAALWNRRTE